VACPVSFGRARVSPQGGASLGFEFVLFPLPLCVAAGGGANRLRMFALTLTFWRCAPLLRDLGECGAALGEDAEGDWARLGGDSAAAAFWGVVVGGVMRRFWAFPVVRPPHSPGLNGRHAASHETRGRIRAYLLS
jgi:hypothetical protein